MTQSKAREFEGLFERADYFHARPDRGNPGDFQRAKSAFNSFCWHNSALIARALRRDEAIEAVDTSKVFTDKMLVGVAKASGFDYSEPIIADVLVAFRKAPP